MKFDWDEKKNANNVKKHGIHFDDAVLVFDDPFQIMAFDQYVDGEARWQTIGKVNDLLLLLVVNTFEDEDGEEFARIISAREVIPHERRLYEEGL
jgi:uncharacterized protein